MASFFGLSVNFSVRDHLCLSQAESVTPLGAKRGMGGSTDTLPNVGDKKLETEFRFGGSTLWLPRMYRTVEEL